MLVVLLGSILLVPAEGINTEAKTAPAKREIARATITGNRCMQMNSPERSQLPCDKGPGRAKMGRYFELRIVNEQHGLDMGAAV